MNRRHHQSRKPRLDGLELARLMYSTGETKETTSMNTTPETSAVQRAEQAGDAIAGQFLNTLLNARDQAEAYCALKTALCDAFNDESDPIVAAVAAGFSGGIVNVLERGIQAIKADA